MGHLLAAQPRGAATTAGGEPDVFGLEVGATLAQEVRQLVAAALLAFAEDLRRFQCRALSDAGGNIYYQDNSFSCTWIRMIADYDPCLQPETFSEGDWRRRTPFWRSSAWPNS
jgi:hypothetical protein